MRIIATYFMSVVLVMAPGCSTVSNIVSPPPDLVTAEIAQQVFKERPEWQSKASEIASAILAESSENPTLDELERLAVQEIDERYQDPKIREEAYGYVKSIKSSLERDLVTLGILDSANKAVKIMEFIQFMAR